MNLSTGSVWGGMVEAEKAHQTIEGLKLANETGRFNLDQARTNAEMVAKTRAAMQAEAARQLQLESGGVGAQVEAPMLAAGGTKPEATLSAIHNKEYLRELGFAKAAAQAGNYVEHRAHLKNASEAIAKATQAQKEERVAHGERWDKIHNIASAPFDENSLNTTFTAAKQQFPEFDDYAKQLGYKRNPETGRYIWDEEAKEITHAVKELAIKEVDRVRKEERLAKLQHEQKELEEQKRRNQETEAARRRSEQTTREIVELRKDAHDARTTEQKRREGERFTKLQQQTLNRDPVYSNWTKWEMGLDMAQEFKNKIEKVPTAMQTGQIDASQIHGLATMFKNMNEGFRTQAGGKYQMQEITKFNGLYDKFKKYYDSFGSGTPVLSEDRAVDLANTMVEMFDIANRNVVLISSETAERVKRKGGDPQDIAFKGNMQRLLNSGQGKLETKDGKRFLVIGNRRFEIDED